MKTYTYLFIAFILISGTQAQAQYALNTRSGQELLVAADGSYTSASTDIKDSNDSFMGEILDGKEDPSIAILNIEREYLIKIVQLQRELREIEAKSTIKKFELKKDLDKINEKLKASKKAKLDTEPLQQIYNSTVVNYDLEEMKAKKSYKLIMKIEDFRKNTNTDKITNLNAIIEESNKSLGTSVNKIEIYKNDYSFLVDDDNPDYKRHEEDCNISFNGKDTTIGQKRIQHAPQYLFGYTNDKLKHFFKDKDFLNCNAYMTKIDGTYYLNLDIDLSTKDANKNYGFINKKDMIKVSMVNGDNFISNCLYRVEGKLEPYTGHTIYQAVYKLEDIEVDMLSKTELDKLGIIWSSGFEEYDIYEIDILIRQIECIKNAD